MDTTFVMLLGLWMIYLVVHFFIIQHKTTWGDRTTYEKVVSVSGIVSISLVFLGVMFGE